MNLLNPAIQHLALHQIACESAGYAKADQRHAHQNAELGGDLEVVQLDPTQLHVRLRKPGRRTIGRTMDRKLW
jgi:hypothetical protein